MANTMKRSYSEQYFSGIDGENSARNVAVEWLRAKSGRLCTLYVLILWGVFAFLSGTALFDAAQALTILNVVHSLCTFFALHWAKGSPDSHCQGEFNGLTVWEQIDGGAPWTTSKKILILVPTLLALLCLNASNYAPKSVLLNLPVYLLCVVPKVPAMHGVRILGINSTVGVDDKINVKKKK
ncbi:ORMDL family-domain-containing protein [Pelagophyceae sp. CCMP2097]|nr:ORMDL family-domain-containing protein [Pelagophyceae sp. CCMP2097]